MGTRNTNISRLIRRTLNTMPRTPIVGGNWKCNSTKASIEELMGGFKGNMAAGVEVVVFPPMIYMEYTKSIATDGIMVGAQNCYTKTGAFTGEIHPAMIKDMGYDWTIIGHSERRTIFGESDELLAEKCRIALDAGVKVTYCIGELLEERENGTTMDVCIKQLSALKAIIKDEADWANIVIAYEPVWAIGTGKVATPEVAQETHLGIRKWFTDSVSAAVADGIRIQYGGSVKAKNAADLAAQPDIDGFLVGGASLKPEFADVVKSLAA